MTAQQSKLWGTAIKTAYQYLGTLTPFILFQKCCQAVGSATKIVWAKERHVKSSLKQHLKGNRLYKVLRLLVVMETYMCKFWVCWLAQRRDFLEAKWMPVLLLILVINSGSSFAPAPPIIHTSWVVLFKTPTASFIMLKVNSCY